MEENISSSLVIAFQVEEDESLTVAYATHKLATEGRQTLGEIEQNSSLTNKRFLGNLKTYLRLD